MACPIFQFWIGNIFRFHNLMTDLLLKIVWLWQSTNNFFFYKFWSQWICNTCWLHKSKSLSLYCNLCIVKKTFETLLFGNCFGLENFRLMYVLYAQTNKQLQLQCNRINCWVCASQIYYFICSMYLWKTSC